MRDRKVIPFRKKPPSRAEVDAYRQATKRWSPAMRRLMFPEHFRAAGAFGLKAR